MTISNKLLPVHKRFDISFTHGEGAYLFSEGRKYLDFGAGIAVNVLGHCHPRLVGALTEQAKKLWHVSNIYSGNELNLYAENLVKKTFANYVFFCNSGAEAVECAIKMIRRHFFVKGQAHKNRIITFKGAFHGRTIATISAAGKDKYLEGFRPALEGFDNVEFGDIEAVRRAVTENTAGILIEPIQGEEGVVVANRKFISELRELCDEKGLLLAFDEVQCGLGRMGMMFAYEYYEVKPDIMALAKAIAGGFPLGACLATRDAAAGMDLGTHGTTYGGNPLAMVVADEVLSALSEYGFLQNVSRVGAELKMGLLQLQDQFPDKIVDVRGVGLMLGIKMNDKIDQREIVQKLIDNGLLVIPAGNNVLRILPPLNIESEHVVEGLRKMREVFAG